MAYVLHRTPCCRSKWELKHGKGGGEKRDSFFMKITYLGDGNNPVNFLLKKVNAFGDTYDLDESSINKMTLDGTEIKFEDLTLANKGEYGGTTDIYTYVFNDTNEHELIIYSDSLETLRFTGLNGGPGGSDNVRFKNIKSIDINNVTSIGQYAFSSCSSLTSINIPDSVTSIGDSAFSSCSSLTSINIPDSVTSIGDSAFQGCSSLTSINIPDSVTSIGDSAFQGCSSLTSITIPNSITSIGNYAFNNCGSLTSITIPNSVTSIGDVAFYGCSGLTSIEIPDSVTSIGQSAFSNCTSLTSVTIGNSVTSISDNVFYRCDGLISIVSNAITAPTISNYTFQSVKTGGTLTVPVGSTGYDVWMSTGNYYLGSYGWTKIEQ